MNFEEEEAEILESIEAYINAKGRFVLKKATLANCTPRLGMVWTNMRYN